MLPRLREPSSQLDLVVGFGPTHLPMEWLYAYSVIAREGWSRDWLLSRVQASVPTTMGRRVAWTLTVEQYYFWDAFESAGHKFVVKLTDPLVRHTFRDHAVTNIERLFIDVQREMADPYSATAQEMDLSTVSDLASSHLGVTKVDSRVHPAVIVDAPAFKAVVPSVRLGRAC